MRKLPGFLCKSDRRDSSLPLEIWLILYVKAKLGAGEHNTTLRIRILKAKILHTGDLLISKVHIITNCMPWLWVGSSTTVLDYAILCSIIWLSLNISNGISAIKETCFPVWSVSFFLSIALPSWWTVHILSWNIVICLFPLLIHLADLPPLSFFSMNRPISNKWSLCFYFLTF